MGKRYNVVPIAGSIQTAELGRDLEKFAVVIADADTGRPVGGIPVEWVRVDGGKGTFIQSDLMTAPSGIARAAYVPSETGRYRIECLVGTEDDSTVFIGNIKERTDSPPARNGTPPREIRAPKDIVLRPQPAATPVAKTEPMEAVPRIASSLDMDALAYEFNEPLKVPRNFAPTPLMPTVARRGRSGPSALTVLKMTAIMALIAFAGTGAVLTFGYDQNPSATPAPDDTPAVSAEKVITTTDGLAAK